MARTSKQFIVIMHYDNEVDVPPTVKDWWARQQVEDAISNSLEYQNDRITGVTVSVGDVGSLSSWLREKLGQYL